MRIQAAQACWQPSLPAPRASAGPPDRALPPPFAARAVPGRAKPIGVGDQRRRREARARPVSSTARGSTARESRSKGTRRWSGEGAGRRARLLPPEESPCLTRPVRRPSKVPFRGGRGRRGRGRAALDSSCKTGLIRRASRAGRRTPRGAAAARHCRARSDCFFIGPARRRAKLLSCSMPIGAFAQCHTSFPSIAPRSLGVRVFQPVREGSLRAVRTASVRPWTRRRGFRFDARRGRPLGRARLTLADLCSVGPERAYEKPCSKTLAVRSYLRSLLLASSRFIGGGELRLRAR